MAEEPQREDKVGWSFSMEDWRNPTPAELAMMQAMKDRFAEQRRKEWAECQAWWKAQPWYKRMWHNIRFRIKRLTRRL